MKYFVDTSFWCALYDRHDANHKNAASLWKALSALPLRLFTSEYIFDETVTLIRRKIGHKGAVNLGEAILKSRALVFLDIKEDVRHGSWEMFKKYADQGFSFTDCTSFVLMQTRGLKKALAYDKHFILFGFTLNHLPEL
jgi:predicted nucleic acid-binding protein